MAIYKTVKGVSKNNSGLKKILEYVGKEKNQERIYKTSGINISENYEKAFKQMMITKRLHNNLEGRQYRHHIQSFNPEEITPEIAHEIAIKFAEKNFKGFDVFISTHIDKDHIHNHFIINTVHNETGLKFNELNKREIAEKKENNISLREHEFILENLKKSSDDLCKEYGLSVIDRTKTKSLNIYDKKIYNAITKNNGKSSYKTQLALTIQREMKHSKSKEEFIKNMSKYDVIVDWQNNKKHITFKFLDTNKKSIRLSNLEKTYKESFFTKQGLEKEFIKNQEQEQEQVKIKNNINPEYEKKREEEYQKILAEQRLKEQLRREKEKKEKEAQLKLKRAKSRGFGIGD